LAAVALELFDAGGFERTSLERIAEAAGVSRRTVLRYYASKNDIVWGAFDEHLDGLRRRLAAAGTDEPLIESIRREVIAFNDYGSSELPTLRRRMTLIMNVPALQGHAMLRHADWCAVIAEFAAARLGVRPDGYVPQLLANVSLGVALSAYRCWISDPTLDLLAELDDGFQILMAGFADDALCAS
jgi:mycofactocin system transcriptional regulator